MTPLEIVFVFVIAGTGAYLGSYLREKGRNLATREDVDRLVRATEEIKSQISGELWVRQRVWDFKKDIYQRLLEQLGDIRDAAFIAETIETRLRERGELAPAQVDMLKKQTERMTRAVPELRRLTAVGRVFLRQAAIDAILKVEEDLRTTPPSDGELISRLKTYADRALQQVTAEAKEDLKL
jgi:hypothetical protein